MSKRHVTMAAAAAAGLLALWAPAWAVALKMPPGAAPVPARVTQAAPAPVGGQPTLDLARGTIEAVLQDKRQIQLTGRLLEWDAKKLRVIGLGGGNVVSVASLRKGTVIRYALDPTVKSPDRPVILIYVDKP